MSAPYEHSPALAAIATVRHGFFGRAGGGSTGAYASNNMSTSTGDTADHVAANRAGAAAALGFAPASLCLLKQVHSATVVTVDAVPADGSMIEADAMVTRLPALALGIMTADCTPILLADPQAGVIGAAHAGWRGAVDGIMANTVTAMVALGADPGRIIAAIGPTISGPNYEVGDGFRADFLALHPTGGHYFTTPPGKQVHFDLPAFVIEQLAATGIGQIERIGGCTYAEPTRYFSHRYATHRGTTTGRQMAIIGLS